MPSPKSLHKLTFQGNSQINYARTGSKLREKILKSSGDFQLILYVTPTSKVDGLRKTKVDKGDFQVIEGSW